MKLHKILIRAAINVARVLVALPVLPALPALANEQASRPDNKPAAAQTSAVPPGHRLEKTTLCYEERHPPAMGMPGPIKRHEMQVGVLVPQDDCHCQ
jgi:hypothetical protein